MDGSDEVVDTALLARLRALQGEGQPDLVSELIGDFLAETPALLDRLRVLAHAGEAREVARLAHGLAGASAALGALQLARCCYALEEAALAPGLSALAPQVDALVAAYARAGEALELERAERR